MRIIRGLEHLSHEEGLRVLSVGVVHLREEKVQGDFIASFQYLKESYRKTGERYSIRECQDRARNNSFKLEEIR